MSWDVALIDIRMRGMDGIELQRRIDEIDPELITIMMTGYASVDTAINALKNGAYDYILGAAESVILVESTTCAAEGHGISVAHLFLRQPIVIAAAEPETGTVRPSLVAGFELPMNLRYHGADLELVSPIEGTVVGVNDKVLQDPELARRDPYGEGWLLMVSAPDVKTNFRNLLQGSVARRWLAESAAALRAAFAPASLATAQDGGVAVNDLGTQLPPEQWNRLEAELFLT